MGRGRGDDGACGVYDVGGAQIAAVAIAAGGAAGSTGPATVGTIGATALEIIRSLEGMGDALERGENKVLLEGPLVTGIECVLDGGLLAFVVTIMKSASPERSHLVGEYLVARFSVQLARRAMVVLTVGRLAMGRGRRVGFVGVVV